MGRARGGDGRRFKGRRKSNEESDWRDAPEIIDLQTLEDLDLGSRIAGVELLGFPMVK